MTPRHLRRVGSIDLKVILLMDEADSMTEVLWHVLVQPCLVFLLLKDSVSFLINAVDGNTHLKARDQDVEGLLYQLVVSGLMFIRIDNQGSDQARGQDTELGSHRQGDGVILQQVVVTVTRHVKGVNPSTLYLHRETNVKLLIVYIWILGIELLDNLRFLLFKLGLQVIGDL